MDKLIAAEAKKHHRISTISDMKTIMLSRLQHSTFRVDNIDVKRIKESIMQQREEAVAAAASGAGDAQTSLALQQIKDVFMEDYQMLSNKCNHANQLCLELNKSVLFGVQTLPFFDIRNNCKADRIVVTRQSHYSDPELQLQMTPPQFEKLAEKLKIYFELAQEDGEDVAAETLDDDPFIPEETDTLLGEAKLKLTGRKMPKEEVIIPVTTITGDKIGQMTLEVTFKLISKSMANCYDMKQMENENVSFMIEVIKVDMEIAVSYCFLTFCAVSNEVVGINNKGMNPKKRYTHEFNRDDIYEIPEVKVTPAFRNFLSAPGILFKVWVPVFEDTATMPPLIAFKITSKKVEYILYVLFFGFDFDLILFLFSKIQTNKQTKNRCN